MRQVTEKDLGHSIGESVIIPNMIDTSHFRYVRKDPEQRNRILILRSFSTRKYANDISMAVIKRLAKRPAIFNALAFSIYGQGKLFNKLTQKVKRFDNVEIHNRFLDMDEIAAVHAHHGVILIPTRQDAQGVTMCEAMSSGLVPVTSNNTAIPEFLSPEGGFLTRSVSQLAEAIIRLHKEPATFNRMSAAAASHIREICSAENTIDKELALITA
jgi:glycosyltransferase involved in cell wall biosynthesis